MRHAADEQFWKLYHNLPEKFRKLADKNFAPMKADPWHPSLNLKKLHNDLWSARVGRDYRVIATKESYGFLWFWIGPHDEYERMIRDL